MIEATVAMVAMAGLFILFGILASADGGHDEGGCGGSCGACGNECENHVLEGGER